MVYSHRWYKFWPQTHCLSLGNAPPSPVQLSGSVTFLGFWVHVEVFPSILLAFTGLLLLSILPGIWAPWKARYTSSPPPPDIHCLRDSFTESFHIIKFIIMVFAYIMPQSYLCSLKNDSRKTFWRNTTLGLPRGKHCLFQNWTNTCPMGGSPAGVPNFSPALVGASFALSLPPPMGHCWMSLEPNLASAEICLFWRRGAPGVDGEEEEERAAW